MTSPGESPVPPPPAPPSTEPGRRLRRPYICGGLVLLVALEVARAAFWPWVVLETEGEIAGGTPSPWVLTARGYEMTGWSIYQATADTGDNPLLILKLFPAGFSPMFTGLTWLIADGLLALAALLLLASPKVRQPARSSIPHRWRRLIVTLGCFSVLPPAVNMASLTWFWQSHQYLAIGGGLAVGGPLALVGGAILVFGTTGSPLWWRRRTTSVLTTGTPASATPNIFSQCPACGRAIHREAKRCPYCRTDLVQ